LSGLNRQINAIQREEEKVKMYIFLSQIWILKVKREIKAAAKKGDKDVCMILAKSIVHSRKANNIFLYTLHYSKLILVCWKIACNLCANKFGQYEHATPVGDNTDGWYTETIS
jgi:hypothetical protein